MNTNSEMQRRRRARLTEAAMKCGFGTIDQLAQAILGGKVEVKHLTQDPVYDRTTTIMRSDFKTEEEYKKRYLECVQHYTFKSRIDGGWIFFRFMNDYFAYKNV